jgi:hypothetical protein
VATTKLRVGEYVTDRRVSPFREWLAGSTSPRALGFKPESFVSRLAIG